MCFGLYNEIFISMVDGMCSGIVELTEAYNSVLNFVISDFYDHPMNFSFENCRKDIYI